jgi:hypothetical protein
MNRITKILTTACLFAVAAGLLNPASAQAKGPAKSNSVMKTKAMSPKVTSSKAKLLTLTKKAPTQFKKAKPVSNFVVHHNHRRRYENLCWDFGCYLGGWDPCFATFGGYDVYRSAEPTYVATKTVATMQEPSDDDGSDDDGESDDSDGMDINGICAN